MFSTDLDYYYPCISAVAYYVTVFSIAEFARKILDKTVRHSSSFYVFAIELIGTAQMCTCVYENGDPYRLLTLLLAETVGGFCAFRFARSLWYQTLQYSEAHRDSYINDACTLNYKVTNFLVFLYLFSSESTILIFPRSLFSRLKNCLPALVYIGVPGLNPVVASSRMFGCSGIDAQWFIALYWVCIFSIVGTSNIHWVCPVIGWLGGAALQKSIVKKVPKKKKTN
uniref:Aquaporin n=1 Tax=Heterorhabditis bacteriophora TaxID=37862 RepID=A0A1I7X9Q3_HETBA